MNVNQRTNTLYVKSTASFPSIRFQGLARPVPSEVISEIPLKPLAKFFTWLDSFMKARSDEIINILVTAFGTGVIAPFIIALNPFNEEDKHTKIYSALRQPISAVLAVITQVGINAPIPKWLVSLGQQGILGEHYLGPLYKIPSKDLEGKNKRLTARYEKAMQNPDYREKVAKMINLTNKEAYDYDLRMVKKGRSQLLPAWKTVKASEVKIEDALLYTSKRLGKLKYLTGFVLSVITLYPTCVLLNWLYPRVMDAFFPQLTAGDRINQKSGNTQNQYNRMDAIFYQLIAGVRINQSVMK